MKCGIKECESTNCFRKCGIKDCDPSIFREMRNKNCEVLSKNWKNLHLAMLILACTNYISQPENNFFNMKSETIIISDIKLFSKKIVLLQAIYSWKCGRKECELLFLTGKCRIKECEFGQYSHSLIPHFFLPHSFLSQSFLPLRQFFLAKTRLNLAYSQKLTKMHF